MWRHLTTWLLVFAGLAGGCGPKPPIKPDPLTHGEAGTERLGKDMTADAAKAAALATTLAESGLQGKVAAQAIVPAPQTPAEVQRNVQAQQELLMLWQRVADLVDPVKVYAAQLLSYAKDVEAVKRDIQQAKVDRQKLADDLAAERSEGQKRLRWLEFISVIGIGVVVAFGLWMKDLRFTFAGGIACAVMGVAAHFMLALTEAMPYFKWGLIGSTAASGIWVLVEWRLRGGGLSGLKQALMTDPLTDLLDLLRQQQAGPPQPPDATVRLPGAPPGGI